MSSDYRIAPIFLIRLAGASFEALDGLATRETCVVTRALLAGEKSANEEQLVAALDRELGAARKFLLDTSRKILPRYLLFASSGTENLAHAFRGSEGDLLPPRNNRSRGREQHLLLYLQRLCAKNDTFSEFGPSGWGRVDKEISGIAFAPRPGVTAREVFLERWTAHALAEMVNADPEIFDELLPRLNPDGRIENGSFLFTDTGETAPLCSEDLEIVKRCDGKTAVHGLGAPVERVRALVERNILRCAVEVPALEPHAFAILCDDVAKWRDGNVRQRWLSLLRPIADAAPKFAEATETNDRQQILQEARSSLQALGAERQAGDRSLYSAVNPIGEECFRECDFAISDPLINEVAVEAAPWIDLWRDSYAFIASRVAVGLRRVFEKAPVKNDAIPLPAFLQACAGANLPLTGSGLVALAVVAFEEVKAAFRERLRPHADLNEYELTLDDCHVVRKTFQFQQFDEYTYPSADLQIAAKSVDAVAHGDYQWLLAELHPPIALLHHCMYWSCPDKAALNGAFAQTVAGKPNLHFGFFAADFTAHTTVRLFDALPDFSNFVAPQRGNPNWHMVRPADAEVYIDDANGDVCVRKTGSHEYLGSFARAWIIPLGFHPFQFSLAPHTPRLRCGRVIVQRRTWTVSLEEWPDGNYTGVSRDLVLVVEQLRARRNWPRYVYIRPTAQALRRSGAEGRDKDTKPVFIDLESYLFLEIFYRWLVKSGELEVTEMLPDPDHLPWREPGGRHTFELRTLIVPHS